MEFTVGLTFHVPKAAWETDPDAEHTSLMNDMKYIVEADRLGFKYGLVAEHHFLHEYSHTAAPEVELEEGSAVQRRRGYGVYMSHAAWRRPCRTALLRHRTR